MSDGDPHTFIASLEPSARLAVERAVGDAFREMSTKLTMPSPTPNKAQEPHTQ